MTTGGTFADWGPTGRTQPNPYVSIDATWVLRTAGAEIDLPSYASCNRRARLRATEYPRTACGSLRDFL